MADKLPRRVMRIDRHVNVRYPALNRGEEVELRLCPLPRNTQNLAV